MESLLITSAERTRLRQPRNRTYCRAEQERRTVDYSSKGLFLSLARPRGALGDLGEPPAALALSQLFQCLLHPYGSSAALRTRLLQGNTVQSAEYRRRGRLLRPWYVDSCPLVIPQMEKYSAWRLRPQPLRMAVIKFICNSATDSRIIEEI